jgi:hypothetical protein
MTIMKALAEDWQAPVKNQSQTSSEQGVVIDWDWKRYLVDQGMAPENLPLRAGLTQAHACFRALRPAGASEGAA